MSARPTAAMIHRSTEPLLQPDPGSTRYDLGCRFTYIRITNGFWYLAVILDDCGRKVVGYGLSKRLDTPLALAASHSGHLEQKASSQLHSPHGPRVPVPK